VRSKLRALALIVDPSEVARSAAVVETVIVDPLERTPMPSRSGDRLTDEFLGADRAESGESMADQTRHLGGSRTAKKDE